ncbi:Sorting nexin-4 [Choanephora cucurbitarum]|uniref:Sorting nexin-4 n=1 Tax=Choanephora cucurbitarum TaxID=101091 RepID=A0A1C7N3X3_9FUNG|nr:Sorting nexin-4 [Choanephora cucurbitarum]
MNEEYVEWDVHAAEDSSASHLDFEDPLTQHSKQNNYYPYDTNTIPITNTAANQSVSNDNSSVVAASLPSIIPSSSPILDPSDSFIVTNDNRPSPPTHTKSAPSSSTPSPFSNNNSLDVVEQPLLISMTISVSDPQKHHDPQGAFITYLITTHTEIKTFASQSPRPVRRRYQDFLWLHTALTLEYPACIVPPLPEKHRLEYIKGDRFSSEFIQRRMISLQWFLDRIARHPLLQKSQSTRIFLSSSDFRNDKRAQMMHIPASSSLLDSISDTLVNAFAKLRKPDERFESMKENIHRLEENLNTVERLYMRINKRQQDLQNDYQSFANCIQGLSSLESNITNSLCRFADVSRAYAKAMKEMAEKEELQFLNEIHELLAYCHAAKEVLKARDQKQLDFEALSIYLQQTEILLERTQYPGRKFNDRGVGIGGIYISDYVTDKLNEVRGVNIQKARQEKLKRLEQRIKELQNAVTKANDESIGFSNQVSKEYDIFQKTKMMELKQGLIAYADCHVNFYKKGTTLWEDILPVLERIDGAKGDGEFPEV